MDGTHRIHSRNGRIGNGTDTSPADIDAIIAALRDDGQGHLLLHFHGGLVNKAAGQGIAERLTPRFSQASYPVFSVWESGFVEAIRNNLRELPQEDVFKNLVRKVLEYALGRLGGSNGERSIAPGAVDPERVRATVDSYWEAPDAARVPYRDFEPIVAAPAAVNEEEIEADLEEDRPLKDALATLPGLSTEGRSALNAAEAAERDSAFNRAVAGQLADAEGARGIITWYKVARLVARILRGVLRRYAKGRDHGLYATVVEEVLRGVHLGGSGLNEWGKALQWNRMKQDTLDAFGDDPDLHAGTALLTRLRDAHAGGMPLTRITLVGHSTGAVYIANWLDRAADLLPDSVAFDVIFLAPAITYDRFAGVLERHGDRIANFRMFCMRDEHERRDQVIGDDTGLDGGQDWKRFAYPSSLLYLVSGVLESRLDDDGEPVDEPDMPLLGMERFYAWREVYRDAEFPRVAAVRQWLQAAPHRAVWSKSEGQAAGLNSTSIDHGAFDNDENTLLSIDKVLRGW